MKIQITEKCLQYSAFVIEHRQKQLIKHETYIAVNYYTSSQELNALLKLIP